jgi:hypothetical protein
MSLLDVAHEIKLDHDNVRDLYARFTAATAVDEKAAIANTMIREMAIHADAECAPPPPSNPPLTNEHTERSRSTTRWRRSGSATAPRTTAMSTRR